MAAVLALHSQCGLACHPQRRSGSSTALANPAPIVLGLKRRSSGRDASSSCSSSSSGLVSRDFSAHAAGPAQGVGLSPELKAAIDTFITENKVVVFLKGTKQMPLCGFSNTVVQILNALDAPYVTVNILEDDLLRSGMKEYSAWPTFPQVYVGGEFYGGCDIMIAAYQSGELAEVLEAALNS